MFGIRAPTVSLKIIFHKEQSKIQDKTPVIKIPSETLKLNIEMLFFVILQVPSPHQDRHQKTGTLFDPTLTAKLPTLPTASQLSSKKMGS